MSAIRYHASYYLSQTAAASVQPPFSRRWLQTVIRAWDFTGSIPQRISPFTPGSSPASVPFSRPWLSVALRAWDEQFTARSPRNLSPAIPGMSIDNPPGLIRSPLFLPAADPLPQSQRPIAAITSLVAAAASVPYFRPWIYGILTAWAFSQEKPQERRLLNPFFTAVAVDNPPFGIPSKQLELLIRSWQPPAPMPQAARIVQIINGIAGICHAAIDRLPWNAASARSASIAADDRGADNPAKPRDCF